LLCPLLRRNLFSDISGIRFVTSSDVAALCERFCGIIYHGMK
jgi:hypothetical protein